MPTLGVTHLTTLIDNLTIDTQPFTSASAANGDAYQRSTVGSVLQSSGLEGNGDGGECPGSPPFQSCDSLSLLQVYPYSTEFMHAKFQ